MRRAILLLGVAALVLAIGAPPAGAVWGGEEDGNQHPMVGALYADFGGDGITWDDLVCSGSYAGPSVDGEHDVFLTAGHCVAWAPAEGIETFYVSFDGDPEGDYDGTPEGPIQAEDYALHPLYGSPGFWANPHDSAVLLLPAGSVTGISPVHLPSAGYLDEQKHLKELQHSQIELAGYGVVPLWQLPGGPQFTFDGVRRTGTAEMTGLTRSFLRFEQNAHATGQGGICYGDSGSPNLIPGTLIVVSTTTGVAGVPCNAFGVGYRLDTQDARDFLGGFLPLP